MLWQPGSRRVQHQRTSIGWWRIPIPASSPAEIIHIRFGLIRKRDYSTLHVSHTRVQSNFLWWKNIPHHCLRRGISGYSPHREPLYVLCSLPILGIIISRIQPYILKTRYYTIKCTKNQTSPLYDFQSDCWVSVQFDTILSWKSISFYRKIVTCRLAFFRRAHAGNVVCNPKETR